MCSVENNPTTADEALALEVDNLAVRFGTHVALESISFGLPRGSYLAVLGPNGGGKSTLLKVVLGLVPPTSGEVRAMGQPLGRADARKIGYVPQFKTLDRSFPAQAIELVVTGIRGAWPGRISREERAQAEAAMEQVGVAELAKRPVSQLSGGELQRVYLARSIIREPQLILLDEPATGMDVSGEADMYKILEEYQERTGATIILITHDWGMVYHHATHVLVVNRHQLAFGPPSESLTEGALSRAFGHMGHAHSMQPGGTCGHDHSADGGGHTH